MASCMAQGTLRGLGGALDDEVLDLGETFGTPLLPAPPHQVHRLGREVTGWAAFSHGRLIASKATRTGFLNMSIRQSRSQRGPTHVGCGKIHLLDVVLVPPGQ